MKLKLTALYAVFGCVILAIVTMGATYAYFAGTTNSEENAIKTKSTVYSISMEIEALDEYTGFSFIPMNDEDVMKALNNKCKDKYNRGACSAYNIRVYGYDPTLTFISGHMDITTNNMENISYMVFEETDTITNEEECITINEKNYCKSINPTSMGTGENLPLGSSYSVVDLEEKNLLLVIWLTNLNERQNDIDIGSFNATVTIEAGNGGEIKGTINAAINNGEFSTSPGEEPDTPEPIEPTEPDNP